MRKSTLFISAALTAFMLAVLFGVVSAYQDIVSSNELAAEQPASPEASQMAALESTQIPLPTQALTITPEEAAALASSVLGRTDLYSVEVTQLDSADVYLVTFSSGDLVYMSLDGRVLSISKLAVTIISQPSSGGGGGGGKNKGGGDDEHEEGDDD